MWPLSERSRIDNRRLPRPMYEPSGERWSHNPLSFGPRCRCTAVIRDSVSRFPQFARPLMPHIRVLYDRQFTRTARHRFSRCNFRLVHLRLDLKKLNALQPAIDQSRDAIKKSQAKHVFVKHEQQRGSRQAEEFLAYPSASLGL